MSQRAFLKFLSLALGLVLVVCESGQPIQIEDPELTTQALSSGETLYERNCRNCHGVQGAGDGSYLANLSRRYPDRYRQPIDFRKPAEYRYGADLSTIASNIKRGVPHSIMEGGFDRLLSDEEIVDVAKYIVSLQQR